MIKYIALLLALWATPAFAATSYGTGTSYNSIVPTSQGGTGVSNTGTLTFSGTASVTGVNTGDQTSVTGNAGTATALQTARAIGIGGSTGLTATGVNFNGTAAINPSLTGTLVVGNGGTGASSFTTGSVLFMGASTISQDNSSFFYDSTNHRIYLGSNSTIPFPATVNINSSNVPISSANGNLAIYSNTAAAIDLGGSLAFGGANDQATTPYLRAFVAGRQETASGYAGYLQLSTVNSSGVGVEHLRITSTGHTEYTGNVPTVGSGAGDCGTSPVIVGNDNVFRITVGSGVNGNQCTVTFAGGNWTNVPICHCENESALLGVKVVPSVSTVVVSEATLSASQTLSCSCRGYR